MELVVGAIAVAILIGWLRRGRRSQPPEVLTPPPPQAGTPKKVSQTERGSIPAPKVLRSSPKAFEFCALDTETTGLVPKSSRHRAFEISCVRFTPVDEWSWSKTRFTRYIRVDPREMKGLKLSPMWDHHVSSGGQQSALEASRALGELEEFVRDLPLVCHNARFDKCVVENEIAKTKHKWRPGNRWICTLLMARSCKAGTFIGYSPGRPDGLSYKLQHVAGALKIPLEDARLHHGHYDAEIAGDIFLKLRRQSVPLVDLN
ncbi:3'-5' exonuclease [Palleronia sp. KMU-117]|uniref:3'-5' exonuclease n=1 Tax=Palleronia sp. KMU-117 TaxID=3434108 RepID=UPI003D72E987